MQIEKNDVEILRELLKKKMEYANLPIQEEKSRLWTMQKDLKAERPMVLVETSGIVADEMPIEEQIQCKGVWARSLEKQILLELFQHESVGDDSVIEPVLWIDWDVDLGDFGVKVEREYITDANNHQVGYKWDPQIKNIKEDFHLLKKRKFSVNKEKSVKRQQVLQELFGDILDIQIHGNLWWTFGLTWNAIDLIGLENLMIYMYDQPKELHMLMQFLMEDMLSLGSWAQDEGILSLNTGNDYVGSGTRGYTTHLPQKDWKQGGKTRLIDQWVLIESQETVGISPDMFGEFIFPYHREIAKNFGLVYYGCCEPVQDRWKYLEQIPNLRAISISPWCDEEFMAEAMGKNYVYSRKPNPVQVSTSIFDEEYVRKDIRKTLNLTNRMNVELVLKDVHTVDSKPERLKRWVEIAREEIDKL